jgi:hypothetical protein
MSSITEAQAKVKSNILKWSASTKESQGKTADAKIFIANDAPGNGVKFITEYFISRPVNNLQLSNAWFTSNTLNIKLDSIDSLSNGTIAHFQGKNGFTTKVGSIKLLCNSYSITNLSNITLSLEGLSSCRDFNFARHVLEVNDGVTLGALKGTDAVLVPVSITPTDAGLLNFAGYASKQRVLSRDILSYDLSNNTITIDDTVTGTAKLLDVMPNPPFYVTISQVLEADFYNNNTF